MDCLSPLAALSLALVLTFSGATEVYQFDEQCRLRSKSVGVFLDNKVLHIDQAAVLDFDHSSQNEEYIDCYVTVKEIGMKVSLHFQKLNLNLYTERLFIYENIGVHRLNALSPVGGIYGSLIPEEETIHPGVHDYSTSTNDGMTVYYTATPALRSSHFRLVVTAYIDSVADTCPLDYFLCSNKRCIHSQLRCDGYPNCGELDRSDEAGCYTPPGQEAVSVKQEYKEDGSVDDSSLNYDIGIVAVCVVVGALVVVLLGVVAGSCYKRNRQIAESRQASLNRCFPSDLFSIFSPPPYEGHEPRPNEPPPIYTVSADDAILNQGSVNESPPPYSPTSRSQPASVTHTTFSNVAMATVVNATTFTQNVTQATCDLDNHSSQPAVNSNATRLSQNSSQSDTPVTVSGNDASNSENEEITLHEIVHEREPVVISDTVHLV